MTIWIVYTYEAIPDYAGKTERYRFGELCRALAQQGHDVVWWTSNFDHGSKKHRSCESVVQIGDRIRVRVLHSLGYPSNSSFRRVLHNRGLRRDLLREMTLESRPDLVIAGIPSLEAAEAASLYCQRNSVPFVVDAHDTWPDIYLRLFPRSCRRLARVFLASEFARAKRVFRSATAVTAVSDSYLDWGLGHAARPRGRWDRVFHLGSPIWQGGELDECERKWRDLCEELQLPGEKFLATFVGTLGNFYDVETIARAAEVLDRQGRKDVHFVVVGDGDKAQQLAQISARLGNFTLTGRLPQDRASVLLWKSGVGLSAYTAHATQSLPYKLFAYMSAGLPQLCSLDGEARRLLGAARAGAYYRAGAADQLARMVVRLAERPWLRRYMAQRARGAFSGRYEMELIYPRFAQHLAEVASYFCGQRSARGLRILYFHQYFSTPEGVGGTRSYEMARALIERGHSVTIVCGQSEGNALNLPLDSWAACYRGKIDGIDVIALPINYANWFRLRRRALAFLHFGLRSIGIALREPHDVIFATSTPLTAAIPGIVMKMLRPRSRFVFEVRDLWPELPRALGMRNPFLLGAMSALEWLAYRTADACIGLAPGIVEGIRRRAPKGLPVSMIPNGCDLELFHPAKRRALDLPGIAPGDFVAGFTGAHGVANGLDAVLDAAAELKRRGRHDIKFVLIGDGKCKPALVERALRQGLDNVLFFPPVKKTEIARITASLDCGLQILLNVPAFYFGTSPNKFFDYISAGVPVLINYPGWLAGVVEGAPCGIAIPPASPSAFAAALVSLAEARSFRDRLGQRAREVATRSFSRESSAEKFAAVIEGAFGPSLNRDVELPDTSIQPQSTGFRRIIQ